jgi:hypothetical protein
MKTLTLAEAITPVKKEKTTGPEWTSGVRAAVRNMYPNGNRYYIHARHTIAGADFTRVQLCDGYTLVNYPAESKEGRALLQMLYDLGGPGKLHATVFIKKNGSAEFLGETVPDMDAVTKHYEGERQVATIVNAEEVLDGLEVLQLLDTNGDGVRVDKRRLTPFKNAAAICINENRPVRFFDHTGNLIGVVMPTRHNVREGVTA